MPISTSLLVIVLPATLYIMAREFQVLSRASVVGTVYLTLFLMHGLTAIPYSLELLDRGNLSARPLGETFGLVLSASFFFYVAGAVWAARALRFDLPQA